MAKERPTPDVAEQNDELALIDEEMDKALDSLKAANEKILDLLEHIEGISRKDDPDAEGASEEACSIPGQTDTEDADTGPAASMHGVPESQEE